MEKILFHNARMGYPLWSVCHPESLDDWIESFNSKELALQHHGPMDSLCGIRGCPHCSP